MAKHSRFGFLSGVLLCVLMLSLACPMAVYAQDETPPPATEEAVGTEVPATGETVQPPTEVPALQEPVVTETPVVTEELAATEAPISTSQMQEIAEEPDAAEELTMGEVLETAPEGTEVVVLDENGEALPLVSVEAAQIIQSSDPMWCPAGASPT